MKLAELTSFLKRAEVWLHILFWLFFITSINVEWTESWIKKDFLPESVAPHIALAVPLIFFINTFWLLPKFLNREKWFHYFAWSFTFLFGFEILRSFVFSLVLSISFQEEFFGSNSLVFGSLNLLIGTSIFYSFVYRLIKDWLRHQKVIDRLMNEKNELQLSLANYGEVQLTDTSKIREVFSVKSREGTFLLKAEEITYFKAQGDFVLAVGKNNKKYIVNDSLKNISEQVDATMFFQINRSEIINFNYIRRYKAYVKNRLEIRLQNSEDLLFTSNSRTPNFRSWVESH